MENISLDGVMQAPGRKDEDLRGGFAHGGWAMKYNDEDKGRIMGGGMAATGPLLFGRTTYEDFYKAWPSRTDNPFTEVLDNTPKFVVSTTSTEPLPWKNSTLLKDLDDVARLKETNGKDILVMGSGVLVRSLMRRGLVDECVLLIHPLVLGSGCRLFASDGDLEPMTLVHSNTTRAGVIIATYRRQDRVN
jgi:dihydrofolate reductase